MLLDAGSDEEAELGCVDLKVESDDGEQVAGDFVNPDGTQSLVPSDLLASSSTTFFQSLAQVNTDPSSRFFVAI